MDLQESMELVFHESNATNQSLLLIQLLNAFQMHNIVNVDQVVLNPLVMIQPRLTLLVHICAKKVASVKKDT